MSCDNKFIDHLKTYPVVQVSRDFAYKMPLVKPTRDFILPPITWVRCTEPMKTFFDAADYVGDQVLYKVDWTISWVVSTNTYQVAIGKATNVRRRFHRAEDKFQAEVVTPVKGHMNVAVDKVKEVTHKATSKVA
ncbi:hypothetical protein DICA3_B08086 [Diutina catenulata]